MNAADASAAPVMNHNSPFMRGERKLPGNELMGTPRKWIVTTLLMHGSHFSSFVERLLIRPIGLLVTRVVSPAKSVVFACSRRERGGAHPCARAVTMDTTHRTPCHEGRVA